MFPHIPGCPSYFFAAMRPLLLKITIHLNELSNQISNGLAKFSACFLMPSDNRDSSCPRPQNLWKSEFCRVRKISMQTKWHMYGNRFTRTLNRPSGCRFIIRCFACNSLSMTSPFAKGLQTANNKTSYHHYQKANRVLVWNICIYKTRSQYAAYASRQPGDMAARHIQFYI